MPHTQREDTMGATQSVKYGDFVKVSGGPAYIKPGPDIKGRVIEVGAPNDSGDCAVMVKVASGGTWGFMASHLTVLPRRPVKDA